MLLILLLLFITVLWTIQYRYKRRRLYELAAKIPALPGENPVFGHVGQFIGDTEHIMSLIQRFTYDSLKHGGVSRIWLNHILYTAIIDFTDLEKVAKHCIEKDDAQRFLRNFLGNGVIFAPVPIWTVRRKIMVSALSPKNVGGLIDIFVGTSTILANNLDALCNTGEFNVSDYVSRYSFDSICQTTLGINLNAQNESDVPFLTTLESGLTLVSERMFNLCYQPDWLYKLFRSKYTEHQRCHKLMVDFLDKVILRKKTEEGNKPVENSNMNDENKQQTVLDFLLNIYGHNADDKNVEIREDLISVIIAGTDTTAIAISNTLMMMAKYPEIQERVHQELSSVFEDSDRPIVKDDLPKLQYLERVMKETLRLFPPVPIMARKVLSEISLPSGYILPVGSGVILNIWGAHRNPKYCGPNADHYDPDRFLPERLQSHSTTYIPFSCGPRNCLGYQYAMMSVKVALSSILRRYRVTPKPEEGPAPYIKMRMDVTMKAVDGYMIGLEKRQIPIKSCGL